MDIDRLRYLTAVARTGSVRGAASALGVTPGAVSKGISALEREAGVDLVRPHGRGIELTDDGIWLADRASHLVGELASLRNDLDNRRGREASFCLATHDVFASWFPPVLSLQFLPGVPLTVRERWPGEVEQAVSTRLSDVGITCIPVPTDGVEHIEIARVPMGVFAARGAFPTERVVELPFAVPYHPISGAVGTHGPLDGWPPDAPVRNVVAAMSSLEGRLELVRRGACAVALPAFVAAMHNARVRQAHQLEARSPSPIARWTRRVYIVRRMGASPELTRRVDAVRAAATAFCQKDEPVVGRG